VTTEGTNASAIVPGGSCPSAKILGLVVLVSLLLGLGMAPALPAERDAPLRMVVDYQRDCGKVEHLATYRLNKSGARAEIEIKSRNYWKASGSILETGVTYRFAVKDVNATWKDASQTATAGGCWPEKGFNRWFVILLRPLMRDPREQFFHLTGAIYGKCADGRICGRLFPIGLGAEFTAPADGEFCAFANDIPFMYANNSVSLTVQIERK
jgi:hypothetical protein